MDRIKHIAQIIYRFFPIQLVMIQLKKSHLMVAIWCLLIALISQNVGTKYGIPYLFLSPEYLGQVNWASYFILGFSIGGFFMAYHLYSYIILGPSFPFLITFSRPFYKFSVNNSFFPILFYFILIYNIYHVQRHEELLSIGEIIMEISALTCGIVLFLVASVLYFFKTNIDILKVKGRSKKNKGRSLYSTAGTLFTRENYWFESQPAITYQPSYYFSSLFRLSRARLGEHYDRNLVRDIFRQNHLNASLFEIALVLSFFAMGLLQEYKFVMIPSGASFFLLCTIFLMVVSIFYTWFRTWALSLILLIVLSLNLLSKSTGFLQSENHVYGLSYKRTIPYNLEMIEEIQFDTAALKHDRDHHIEILENWKIDASRAQGTEKPKLIIVNCSGGGLRSAMWTHYILEEMDRQTKGSFFESTHLITGASGGMIGASYFRQIYQSSSFAERQSNKQRYLDNISKDLLNNVAFNLASHDIFLRYRSFELDGQTYLKDRGYSFERQLNENTDFLMDKRLADFVEPEFKSEIPLMIYSPTIINDGRRLIVAAQPYGFLNGTDYDGKRIGPENVEFIKLFKDNHPLHVKYTSVMRMNSTFPYILPMVTLPTDPKIRVMDAGIRDNYGTKSTVRYIVALNEWLKENTSGVVIVEIRDIDKDYDRGYQDDFSLFDRITKPAGNFYGNFYQSQEFNATELVESSEMAGLDVEVITFVLRKDPTEKIALSWHLTQREKNDIKKTFANAKNQEQLLKLLRLLNP